MVSGINANFSLRNLEIIKSDLMFLPTENGEITEETQASMSSDSIRAIKYFGNSKLSLGNKIDDLIEQNEAKNKQTSKEVSPEMDMSLDEIEPPKLKEIK